MTNEHKINESKTSEYKTSEFEKLGISKELLRALNDEKFEKPTEIQELAIPLVLQGKDVIARASTGSGKTLAFGSTILQNTKRDYGIQSLILAPTRELAEQISKALKKFSKYASLNICAIYGGVSFNPQVEDLEYAEVVVGTPGRILDHLSRNTINLKHLKTLVLDEADRMLDMGFIDDVEKIISQCPKERQTLLFSATISQDILRLSKKYMKHQVEVSAEEYVDPTLLTQVYYDVDDNLKFSLLKHLLEHEDAKLVMVFCNTRKNVDFVANNLKFLGLESLPIHGGFSQEKRNRTMEQFNSKKTQVLVCTDIAARGLDIKGVSHIYNYNMPNDAKEYIHRIGRTARAGKEGKVINLISSRDHENFRSILKDDSLKIEALETPELERIPIRWIPEGRRGRDSRGGGRGSSFGGNSRGRESRGGYGRRDSRDRNDDRREYSRAPRHRTDSRDSRHRSSSRDRRPSSSRIGRSRF
ncbi:DEAD/DEAH box helicase [Candidatus Pacearchaeota archaeon]|nr:DEAD/DEAH box helicase [Candidatus Pacearchaeota archaeon]